MKIVRTFFQTPLLLLFFIIPVMGSFSFAHRKFERMRDLKDLFLKTQKIALYTQAQKDQNRALYDDLKRADPLQITKKIEALKFLQPELKRAQKLHLKNPKDLHLQQRLKFLQSENFIELTVQEKRAFPPIQEEELSLKHPVELSKEDLKALLSAVEGCYNKDQNSRRENSIFFKEFDLSKKKTDSGEDVFLVHFKLIQRSHL